MNKFYIASTLVLVASTAIFFPNQEHYYASRSPASNAKKGLTEHNYSRGFLALNTSLKFSGLENFKNKDGEYTKRLFGKLIQESSKIARDDWYNRDAGVFNNYHTFLLSALQVPFHESGLTHLRRRNISSCSQFSNNFLDPKVAKDYPITYYKKIIKEQEDALEKEKDKKAKNKIKRRLKTYKSRERNAVLLSKNMKKALSLINHKNPFPHCSTFENTEVTQLLFSGDYADIGIMMINANAHPSVIKSGMIFDLDGVISYGLNLLYNRGFNKIANDSKDYKCLKGLEKSDRYAYSKALIRGSWAGRYNSGSARKTCRFIDSSNKWALNDVTFLRSLNKILKEDNKRKSFYHHFLPEGSIERKAFFELIKNVKNQEDSRVYLDQVLATNYNDSSDVIADVTTVVAPEDKKEEVVYTLENSEEKTQSKQAELAFELPEKIIPLQLPLNVTEEKIEELQSQEVQLVQDITQNIFDPVSPENDVLGDLPPIEVAKFTHVITTKFLNIRSNPKISKDTYCGHTGLREIQPVEVEVLEKVNNAFVKIKGNKVQDLIAINSCKGQEFYYISKNYIKKIAKREEIKRIRIINWVWARDIPSYLAGRKIKIINPNNAFKVIDERIYGNEYLWYKIVLSSGEEVWIYANDTTEEIE